jgi:hypothetical protein
MNHIKLKTPLDTSPHPQNRDDFAQRAYCQHPWMALPSRCEHEPRSRLLLRVFATAKFANLNTGFQADCLPVPTAQRAATTWGE